MTDLPSHVIRQVIVTFGDEICDQPARLEALLRDIGSRHRMEIFVLTAALKARNADLTCEAYTAIDAKG